MKIALLGPIKYWWSVWGSPEHLRYTAHRDRLRDSLVAAGHLVYCPHYAWQGQWDESAQSVNDEAIRVCDFIINLRPDGVPSEGLDEELRLVQSLGKGPRTVWLPPGTSAPSWLLREVITTS